jgi:TATA-box binding protein (TBP) (component of TFIID and TFIIIB)
MGIAASSYNREAVSTIWGFEIINRRVSRKNDCRYLSEKRAALKIRVSEDNSVWHILHMKGKMRITGIQSHKKQMELCVATRGADGKLQRLRQSVVRERERALPLRQYSSFS